MQTQHNEQSQDHGKLEYHIPARYDLLLHMAST
mgnify:CR=1 FL=1|jgi:hypothetical protein